MRDRRGREAVNTADDRPRLTFSPQMFSTNCDTLSNSILTASPLFSVEEGP